MIIVVFHVQRKIFGAVDIERHIGLQGLASGQEEFDVAVERVGRQAKAEQPAQRIVDTDGLKQVGQGFAARVNIRRVGFDVEDHAYIFGVHRVGVGEGDFAGDGVGVGDLETGRGRISSRDGVERIDQLRGRVVAFGHKQDFAVVLQKGVAELLVKGVPGGGQMVRVQTHRHGLVDGVGQVKGEIRVERRGQTVAGVGQEIAAELTVDADDAGANNFWFLDFAGEFAVLDGKVRVVVVVVQLGVVGRTKLIFGPHVGNDVVVTGLGVGERGSGRIVR